MKETYLVTIDRPVGATVKQMKEHIKNSVDYWGGGRCIVDPLFETKKCSVKKLYREAHS